MTASNFHRITHLRDTTDPTTVIETLMGKCTLDEDKLPLPIAWGRGKEIVARELFLKIHKAEHRHLKFEECGLVMSKKYFFIGASPDGYCKCKVCGEFLLEIKCPYGKRMFSPKIAAREVK